MPLLQYFRHMSYALEKIRMRVGLLDPARAASKSHATEMFTWDFQDTGLEDDLAALKREWSASVGGLPDQAGRLLERASELQAELRQAISKDEADLAVDFRRASAAEEEFEAVLGDLRALAAKSDGAS